MPAEVLRVGASRLLWDDFAVAVARACFEAWTMSTSRRGGDAQCSRREAEVAELRSELAESQQYRALSQAKIKRLEQQLQIEQEWCLEASRFCSNRVDNCSDSTGPPFSHSGSPVDQRLPEPDWQGALDRALLERDQARLEREEMRLELAALQALQSLQFYKSLWSLCRSVCLLKQRSLIEVLQVLCQARDVHSAAPAADGGTRPASPSKRPALAVHAELATVAACCFRLPMWV